MRVCVLLEQRYSMSPDGNVWTDGAFPYSFWTRYLEVFDRVCVVARVKPVPAARPEWKRANGEGVEFSPVTYYLGLQDYLLKRRSVQRTVRASFDRNDAVILRVPSQLAVTLMPTLLHSRHPFAVEVVSDPYDVFAPGAIRHPLRPLFRLVLPCRLRRDCRNAFAAAYVTAESLQRRYPPGPNTRSFYYSDVELKDEFALQPRDVAAKRAWKLLTVSSLAQVYKAVDVQIDAVAQLRSEGLDVRLTVIGEGKHRSELEKHAIVRGLRDYVHFRGQIPCGGPIRDALDEADLFLLPSRAEGLPRALIEAMARALPCIGSRVGGIPELLSPDDLVPAGDARALATKIRDVVTDGARMQQMSLRNLERSRSFREQILAKRRIDFFRYVREYTEAYLDPRIRSNPLQHRYSDGKGRNQHALQQS